MNIEKQFTNTIDASGLRCPMPLLKAKLALSKMGANQVLCLFATDPASQKDLVEYCRQAGFPIQQLSTTNNSYQYLITKTESKETN